MDQAHVPKDTLEVVRQYLVTPDRTNTGVGLTTGGSLSPLLYEQGATATRLRQYVTRWRRWLMGGLDGFVCRKGGLRTYWVRILKLLKIQDGSERLRNCLGR